MNLFTSQPKEDKWKNKYFKLLETNEQDALQQKEKEDLLCKTIIRLSLAASGFSKELDPLLMQIRSELKAKLNNQQLKAALEQFTSALMMLDDASLENKLPDASVLFEFLYEHFPQQQLELQQLESKYEKKGYANTAYLFADINELIEASRHIEVLEETDELIRHEDKEDLFSQLQQLLDGAEIPAQFNTQVVKLKEKIYRHENLPNVFSATVSLLINVKKVLQNEQKELAQFLSHLTDQLTDLGLQATGVKDAEDRTAQKRNLLDQTVSTQMLDLQKSSQNANELETLKTLVHDCLDNISRQIREHQIQEKQERLSFQQQLNALSDKVQGMEKETHGLKHKLVVAQKHARTDPLTGLANRLAYDERLNLEIARWKRYQTPLSLMVCDIDHFKKINDTFGHKSGDKTLILIGQLLSDHCRETDFICRFGGEEFVMLLPNTHASEALKTAEKLRKVVESTAFHASGKKIVITLSCGLTELLETDTPGSVFKRADKALYQAKNKGRNQCTML
jgi:diguanylate cyclase